MRTYTFPVDDGVAVVIPKELASAGEPSGPVEIERVGDTLVIRPLVRRKLTGLAAKFTAFPAGFMAQGREFHEERERLIAAHAISAGATLVTNNEADFRDYPGLVVENWVLAG